MYIFNITTNIDESVNDTWIEWMKTTYIPAMIATGKFLSAQMTKVEVEEEMGGVTYAVQYLAETQNAIHSFLDQHADTVYALNDKFQGKMVSFETEMKIIHTHE